MAESSESIEINYENGLFLKGQEFLLSLTFEKKKCYSLPLIKSSDLRYLVLKFGLPIVYYFLMEGKIIDRLINLENSFCPTVDNVILSLNAKQTVYI